MTRRLDLGSGYAPWQTDDPEWEHLDINPRAPHVEHVEDLAGTLSFGPRTFGELRASDVLEHVPYTLTGPVLREWCRVLEPGGLLTIVTPDAEAIMRHHADLVMMADDPGEWVPEHLRGLPLIVSTAWRLLGGHDDGIRARDGDDWRWNAHYALFSADSLTWYLTEAGFRVCTLHTNAHPNLLVTAERLA